MRICIPTMGKKGMEEIISPHFGRAPTFTIVDTKTNEVEIIENISEHFGGFGKPPEVLKKHNVDIMLCSGIGPRAIRMFEQYGIQIFVNARGKVKDIIQQYKKGELIEATDAEACKEHKH